MLKPGDPAPDFRLPASGGHEIGLRDLRGRHVVLYFYPKDDTPGCTREACEFRDRVSRLRSAGAEVLGISRDSLGSHQSFVEKYDLTFPLLTDEDNRVSRAYGAYGQKVLYGRKFMGTIRSTFLIDPKGLVQAVWSPVKVDGHADAVLARLQGEEAAQTSPRRPKVTAGPRPPKAKPARTKPVKKSAKPPGRRRR